MEEIDAIMPGGVTKTKRNAKKLHPISHANHIKEGEYGVWGSVISVLLSIKALVAKQAWRLIRYPSSLMARVSKAKYFRNYAILEIKLGPTLSFVWRSICWGVELVRSGVQWRVGDGSRIWLFEHPWIPLQIFYQIEVDVIKCIPFSCLTEKMSSSGIMTPWVCYSVKPG
ncbi:hypothetical protein PanWU01x14_266240 [Parasponia andersonii]|uniref:Uncharacterized protein n=1 Tax=Parasponia andersonii TaxID=3476 RepID=A0A2P5B722_PARAD|nr:hypothetical protein PanWU01x14_266240 [Parasponia andersonii]